MKNVHNTNFKRTPHIKSLIPQKPNGKVKPHKGIPYIPRYNGPVYLPKHIYNILSEDIKKEPDKYNQDKNAQYKSRMDKGNEQEHEEADEDLIILNLTWITIPMKNLTLCKILKSTTF